MQVMTVGYLLKDVTQVWAVLDLRAKIEEGQGHGVAKKEVHAH